MFTMFKQLFSMITVWLSTIEIIGIAANKGAGAIESMADAMKEEQDFKRDIQRNELQQKILASQTKTDQAKAAYEASKPVLQRSKPVVNSKPATRTTRKPKTA